MPSLLRTSRTSPEPEGTGRFFDLDLGRAWLPLDDGCSDGMKDEAWSRVEMEDGLASAVLDMLLRPSRASLRSVTPTLLVDRAKLWSEMFSMCINAGDILRRGDTPSPRTDSMLDFSRATSWAD